MISREMKNNKYDIVVIGGGHAGVDAGGRARAAVTPAAMGVRVQLDGAGRAGGVSGGAARPM